MLVLAAADEQALLDGLSESTQTPTDVPWSVVNIHTGTLTQLGARWEQGPWTWVAPRDDTNPTTEVVDSSGWEWTYP